MYVKVLAMCVWPVMRTLDGQGVESCYSCPKMDRL